MPSSADFTDNGGDVSYDTYSEVAINGVSILSSASGEGVDPFYPADWSGANSVRTEDVDACHAHPMPMGNVYHYHILPPCLVNKANIDGSKACTDVTACNSDVATYALD